MDPFRIYGCPFNDQLGNLPRSPSPLLPSGGGGGQHAHTQIEGRTSVKSIMRSRTYLSLRKIVEQEDEREKLKAELDEEQQRSR